MRLIGAAPPFSSCDQFSFSAILLDISILNNFILLSFRYLNMKSIYKPDDYAQTVVRR
jgi:hypothetical protein